MEKLQYDSFYKFLVSLGLVLIITPFIGVYYLLNYSNENLLTVNKYTDRVPVPFRNEFLRERFASVRNPGLLVEFRVLQL